MDKLFALTKELADPAAWSAGVELSRNAEVVEWRLSQDGERFFRLMTGPRDPVRSVALSDQNEAWQCDCTLDEDPCRHVIAAVLCARQGRLASPSTARSQGGASVVHAFTRERRFLAFSRALIFGGAREGVRGTLAEALRSGGRSLVASEADMLVEHVLVGAKGGVLEPRVMGLLVQALSRVSCVELEGAPITASSEPLRPKLVVTEERDGWRIRWVLSVDVDERFSNGVALKEGVLYAIADSGLGAEELLELQGEGRFFPREEGAHLASRVIPALRAKLEVEVQSTVLPRARTATPRIVLETVVSSDAGSLTVIPRLVYGNPAFAEVRLGKLELRSAREVPIRDPAEEGRLARDLEVRLGLKLGEARGFSGAQSAAFAERLRGWDTTGESLSAFRPLGELSVSLEGDAAGLSVRLKSAAGAEISPQDVLSAADTGRRVWHVSGEGWFSIPTVFLDQHRDVVARLLAERKEGRRVAPAALLPDIDEACSALGIAAPAYFEQLRRGLHERETLALPTLPDGLHSALRPYQEKGVAWLSFLRDYGLCGLLADDMGLGKTVQALSVIQGRTLVVAPTSVLRSWQVQAGRFRPSLRCSLYHGSGRSLSELPDILVTSYGLLRQDIEQLCKIEWDTVVLDEAQLIRNPESATARAAFLLPAKWRLSLSGTPVENSLLDLWSQMHFLQPGLLGSRSDFERRYADPIAAGSATRSAELRRRVAPFILRRLKRDVATELPPKTEVVLECELSREERQRYEAILLATRSEASGLLQDGASPLAVLEALLRLRQACCHGALLPGVLAEGSSKVDLLLEALSNSVEQGHRALVFSQWTSLLDLVEPRLAAQQLRFSRLDGSTGDRQKVVDDFQRPEGPDVMLLSLKAGGLGLTLTAADHVYILDPWWNPAAEDQAADRAHRIGQESPVVVHRLVAQGTVEEKILALQARKRDLSREVVGERSEVALSRDELLGLLG
jgi:superfamily II DNA or RNA helicase